MSEWQSVDQIEKEGQILATTHSLPLPGFKTRWFEPAVYKWDAYRNYWVSEARGICIPANIEGRYQGIRIPPLPAPPAVAREEER
ncbi:hypothetical protein [Kaistia adipata]|uniref:hypothetical protein n=1 Tax=Kaistia adipata TaxID=166954 RepID=UPI00048D5992|nr:hypothetical protein [Kaistia adipata]